MVVESMLATDDPPDFETRLDQQQCLARMMQASKVSSLPYILAWTYLTVASTRNLRAVSLQRLPCWRCQPLRTGPQTEIPKRIPS